MKNFRFKVKTKDKKTKEGIISAESQKEAIDKLYTQNLYVISCDEIKEQEAKHCKPRKASIYWSIAGLGFALIVIGFISVSQKRNNAGLILFILGIIIIFSNRIYALTKGISCVIEKLKAKGKNNKN